MFENKRPEFTDDLKKHIYKNCSHLLNDIHCIEYNCEQKKLVKQLSITFEKQKINPIKFLYNKNFDYLITDNVSINYIDTCIGFKCMNPNHVILKPRAKKNILNYVSEENTTEIHKLLEKNGPIWKYNGNPNGFFKKETNKVDVKEYLWTITFPKKVITNKHKLLSQKDNFNPETFSLEYIEKKVDVNVIYNEIIEKCKKDDKTNCLLWPNKKNRRLYYHKAQNISSVIWNNNNCLSIIDTQTEKIIFSCNKDNCCNIEHFTKRDKIEKIDNLDELLMKEIEKNLKESGDCLLWTGKTITTEKSPTLAFKGKSYYPLKDYYRIKNNIQQNDIATEKKQIVNNHCKNPLCFTYLDFVDKKNLKPKKIRTPCQVYNDYCKNNSEKFERLQNSPDVNVLVKKMSNSDDSLQNMHITQGCLVKKNDIQTKQKAIGVCVSTMENNLNQKIVQLPRLAWLSKYPDKKLEDLKDKVIRHLCNNGHLNCHEPSHLYIGTYSENIKDHYNTNYSYKGLTNENAEDIRNKCNQEYNSPNFKTHEQVAEECKTDVKTVNKIVKRKLFPQTTSANNNKKVANKKNAFNKFNKNPKPFIEKGRVRILEIHGDETKFKKSSYLQDKIQELTNNGKGNITILKELQDIDKECHEYSSITYPYISIYNVKFLLTKLALMCHNNSIVHEKQILHKCGNNKCFNPLHLKGGTQSENEIDKQTHGTGKNVLTQEQEQKIIKERTDFGTTYTKLSKINGVSIATIRRIINS